MCILALDPSSTITGYAVIEVDGHPTLREAGRLHGKREARYHDRVVTMLEDLTDLFETFDITDAVIEVPDGKIHRRNLPSGGAGQSVYGFAVGATWALCRLHCARVHPVSVNDWTRGQSKARRLARVQAIFRQFDVDCDAGMDASDAAALGLWWVDAIKVRQMASAAGGRR